MFKQSRVVYIVKNFAGQPGKIIGDLIENDIFKYFFDDLDVIGNRNFLKFIASLPKNTVFCINANYKPTSREISKSGNIAIPFISSHVSFPVKLGELVWFYAYEVQEEKQNTIETYSIDGYYLGRVHSLLNTEDSSYCFHDREISIFSHDKLTPAEAAGKKSAGGIVEALEHNEEFIPSTIDIIEEPSIDIITDISRNILNSPYYHKELLNYRFNPTNTTATMPEDVILKGSHNTVVELGSSQFTDGSSSSGGKIKIVAGNNERLRSQSFIGDRSISVRELDNTILDDKIDVKLFDNGIEAIVDNSIFYETIKTTNQFVNPDAISEDIRQGIVHSLENNINNNSSTLVVSQFGIENDEISQKINYSIPVIVGDVDEITDGGLNITTPLGKEISSITKDYYPSIVGTSDAITFKIHEESDGAIALINPGLENDYHNYVLLKNDNVHINANKIVLGDSNRIGSTLYLGFGDEMQSLVLGEQLNQVLSSIIDIQRISIDTIKNLFKDSKENDKYIKETLKNVFDALNAINTQLITVGSAVGVPPNAQISSDIVKSKSNIDAINIKKYEENIVNFKSNKEEELFQSLTIIRDSLDLILSNFVKSS